MCVCTEVREKWTSLSTLCGTGTRIFLVSATVLYQGGHRGGFFAERGFCDSWMKMGVMLCIMKDMPKSCFWEADEEEEMEIVQ